MTKRELVVQISKETGIIQEDVYTVIQKALDHITESLSAGDTIEFRDFGVFDTCIRRPRVGRNPNRPQDVVQIPARRVVRFRPGKRMREVVETTGDKAPATSPAPLAATQF
jgi:nucleoid DNA-binding protein